MEIELDAGNFLYVDTNPVDDEVHISVTHVHSNGENMLSLTRNDARELIDALAAVIEGAEAEEETRNAPTLCVDCGVNVLPTDQPDRAEWYIVNRDVWEASGIATDGGCLCLACLEKRIGRPLTGHDFPVDIPVNDPAVTDTDRYAWSWRTPKLQALLEQSRCLRCAGGTDERRDV